MRGACRLLLERFDEDRSRSGLMREGWRFLFSACSSSMKLVKVSHSTHVLYNFVMSAQWRQIWNENITESSVSKINRAIHAYYLRARILE